MKLSALVILAAAAALPAGSDPAGFKIWKSTELKMAGKKLAPKIDAKKFASEQMGTFGNHSFMVAHREGNGEAEVHETQADLFIVESGEATLVIGGTLVNGKTSAPHEIRGPSISGGEQKKLSPGDIVHIPAKVPHQLMVAPGKEFTYAIMKVTE